MEARLNYTDSAVAAKFVKYLTSAGIAAGRVGPRLGDMDLQVRGHGQHSGVEGHAGLRGPRPG